MKRFVIKNSADCLSAALEILGDKWTPLLVRELTACPKCFSELELSLTGISPRTLSQRLDKLEAEGIVTRRLYNDRPPRYRYALTEKGNDLRVILNSMAAWGGKYPA